MDGFEIGGRDNENVVDHGTMIEVHEGHSVSLDEQ